MRWPIVGAVSDLWANEVGGTRTCDMVTLLENRDAGGSPDSPGVRPHLQTDPPGPRRERCAHRAHRNEVLRERLEFPDGYGGVKRDK